MIYFELSPLPSRGKHTISTDQNNITLLLE